MDDFGEGLWAADAYWRRFGEAAPIYSFLEHLGLATALREAVELGVPHTTETLARHLGVSLPPPPKELFAAREKYHQRFNEVPPMLAVVNPSQYPRLIAAMDTAVAREVKMSEAEVLHIAIPPIASRSDAEEDSRHQTDHLRLTV